MPETQTDVAGHVARGPRRNDDARRAILASAARLLARDGWTRLTIEGIAADAGVGKQTIYRWWTSKSAVVADALGEGAVFPSIAGAPDTGDLARDLTLWMQEVAAVLSAPGRTDLMRSLIAAAVDNEQVGEALGERLGAAPDTLLARLGTAARSGQLPSGAPLQTVAEALLGAVILRVLYRTPFEAADAATLVRTVLEGVMPASEPGRTRPEKRGRPRPAPR